MAEKAISQLRTIFDWRSKTFWGLVLAFTSILIDTALQLEGLPKIIMSVIQVILFLFAGFGLTDAAKQAKEQLLNKVKDFINSAPACGILIEALAHLSEKIPEMGGVSPELIMAAKILGALLFAMGLRKVSAQARANFENRHQEAVEKYRHLVS